MRHVGNDFKEALPEYTIDEHSRKFSAFIKLQLVKCCQLNQFLGINLSTCTSTCKGKAV